MTYEQMHPVLAEGCSLDLQERDIHSFIFTLIFEVLALPTYFYTKEVYTHAT